MALETVNYHEVEPEMIGERERERERETIWCVNKSYLDLRIITLLLLLLPLPSLCLKGKLRKEEIGDATVGIPVFTFISI